MNKLALNQELLQKKGLLDSKEIVLNNQFSTESKRFKMVYCLNCCELFRTNADSGFIFCSVDCSKEYFLKKKGLK